MNRIISLKVSFTFMFLLISFILIPGCGKHGGTPVVRVDTLSTEQDQLLMINFLPLDLSYGGVKERFPSLGEVKAGAVPGGTLTGTATGKMKTPGGYESIAELEFEHNALTRYSFIVIAESVVTAMMYQRLQSFYTMRYGNYHQELREEGAQRWGRSYWTSDIFAVVVTLQDSAGTHSLRWGFEKLRESNPEQPEAHAIRSTQSPFATTAEYP